MVLPCSMPNKYADLEYRDERSSKFWRIEVDGALVTTRYGRIGNAGSATNKRHGDHQSAVKSAERQVNKKLKQGYWVTATSSRSYPVSRQSSETATQTRVPGQARNASEHSNSPTKTPKGIPITPLEAAWSPVKTHAGARLTTARWTQSGTSCSSQVTIFDWRGLGDQGQGSLRVNNLYEAAKSIPGFFERYVPFAITGDELPGGGDEGVFLFDLHDGDQRSCAVVMVESASSARIVRVAKRVEDFNLSSVAAQVAQPQPEPGSQAASNDLLGAVQEDATIDEVERLLAAGADINHRSRDGVSPLMIACEWGHKDIAAYLIRHGADLHARDKDGMTVEMYAVEGEDPQGVLSVLEEMRR